MVPKDLVAYLEEITRQNRERNLTIQIEAKAISDIFRANQLDFVFIKGVALLARGLFNENYERMIGDIDVLVKPDQCQQAFQLLSKNGYTERIEFNYVTKGFRHLPRQINPEKLAAVEIHSHVLDKKNEHFLSTSELLERKQTLNGIDIPDDVDSIALAIYANQLNNRAYYFNTLDLKITFDVLALLDVRGMNLNKQVKEDKYIKKFFALSSELFPELDDETTKRTKPFYRTLFILSNTYPQFGFLMFKVKSVVLAIYERLNLFLFNKSYRKHVITNKLQLIVILADLFFVYN